MVTRNVLHSILENGKILVVISYGRAWYNLIMQKAMDQMTTFVVHQIKGQIYFHDSKVTKTQFPILSTAGTVGKWPVKALKTLITDFHFSFFILRNFSGCFLCKEFDKPDLLLQREWYTFHCISSQHAYFSSLSCFERIRSVFAYLNINIILLKIDKS